MVKTIHLFQLFLQEQEENKENSGFVEFQVVSFTNKIQRLTSHLELHKKDYLSQRGLQKLWENVNVYWLICQQKNKNRARYKKLIGQLNIRERKTR